MGGEQALYGVASQPISSVTALNFSTDYKKQQALNNIKMSPLFQLEAVIEHQKYEKMWREEHEKKLIEENTTTAEKKYQEIAYQVSKNLTDPVALQSQLGDMQTLFRFVRYNKVDLSFNDNLYLAQNQARLTENTLYKLKNGQDDNTGSSTNPMLYDGSFQNVGERDFLS